MSRPTSRIKVPFCRPDYGQREMEYLQEAVARGKLEGGGLHTRLCEEQLESITGCKKALIVPSCTAALEIMALALNIQAGDEIIMPSFTFVSTANAFALRSGVPVFVDIDPETLNIDPCEIEAAITPKTRAVMIVHYAGVACDMEAITDICKVHNLILLEDAAQAVNADWKGKPLGSFGTFGAISFHHTKNVTCGEGGALILNDTNYTTICETIRDKGTDRAEFLRGEINKYEWKSLGSSFLLSELTAAVLAAQLEICEALKVERLKKWETYHNVFSKMDMITCPKIPDYAGHNGHIYHIRLKDKTAVNLLKDECVKNGIIAAPHYVPLHLTPAGKRFGRASGEMKNTITTAETLIRMPLYSAMRNEQQRYVIDVVSNFLRRK